MSEKSAATAPGSAEPRVAMLPLFYGRPEVVAGCLDALVQTRSAGDFEIFALENPSEHSAENRKRLRAALERGDISGLFASEVNAVFNSMSCALFEDIFELRDRFDYIGLSDGDVAPAGPFLDEQIALLRRHPHIASVALRIDVTQWDSRDPSFPTAVAYGAQLYRADRNGLDYAEFGGGLWMRLFRAEQLFRLVEDFHRNGFRLRDGQIDRYFQAHGMIPACTVRSRGVELPHGPFFSPQEDRHEAAAKSLETAAGFFNLWNHDVAPSGSVEWGQGRPSRTWTARPLAPHASPEIHAGVYDCPGVTQERLRSWDTGRVVQKATWEAPCSGVILILDGQFHRAFVGAEATFLGVPLNVALRGPATPFLRRLVWDLRQHAPPPTVKILQRVLAAASKLLLPEGELVLETLDVASAARRLAALTRRAERAARWGGKARKLLGIATEARDAGRLFAGKPSLLEAGEIVLAAQAEGFVVTGLKRDRAAASLTYTLRPKAFVGAGRGRSDRETLNPGSFGQQRT